MRVTVFRGKSQVQYDDITAIGTDRQGLVLVAGDAPVVQIPVQEWTRYCVDRELSSQAPAKPVIHHPPGTRRITLDDD